MQKLLDLCASSVVVVVSDHTVWAKGAYRSISMDQMRGREWVGARGRWGLARRYRGVGLGETAVRYTLGGGETAVRYTQNRPKIDPK